MAMPRPSGKALKIAQEVVPGLRQRKKAKKGRRTPNRGSMSEVEVIETNQIEDKEGLR